METFKPGDYVKYDGKLSQYNSNIAQIEEFRMYNDANYVSLLNLKDKTNFVAEFGEIKHIELNEHHLKKLGFEKEEVNILPRFRQNNIIISSTYYL